MALVLLLAYAWLRWGEAVALRWSCVDLARRRVRVEALGHRGIRSSCVRDTEDPRGPHRDRPPIRRRDLGRRPATVSCRPPPAAGPLRHSNFAKGRLGTGVSRRGGCPMGCSSTTSRDTVASLAISVGASIKAVQRMLGHASAAMTLDTYGSPVR